MRISPMYVIKRLGFLVAVVWLFENGVSVFISDIPASKSLYAIGEFQRNVVTGVAFNRAVFSYLYAVTFGEAYVFEFGR